MARSTSIFLEVGRDQRDRPLIFIPLDRNRSGSCADRAARATHWLWSRGIYPSPSAVNMRMRGATRDCLNGVETTARNAVMAELGIQRQRRDRRFGWRRVPLSREPENER